MAGTEPTIIRTKIMISNHFMVDVKDCLLLLVFNLINGTGSYWAMGKCAMPAPVDRRERHAAQLAERRNKE